MTTLLFLNFKRKKLGTGKITKTDKFLEREIDQKKRKNEKTS